MFYQVGGNAATNAQFYVTDSTKNFVTASMYFYSKPNFDSILPAADYIKNDMKQIIESIKWKQFYCSSFCKKSIAEIGFEMKFLTYLCFLDLLISEESIDEETI